MCPLGEPLIVPAVLARNARTDVEMPMIDPTRRDREFVPDAALQECGSGTRTPDQCLCELLTVLGARALGPREAGLVAALVARAAAGQGLEPGERERVCTLLDELAECGMRTGLPP